MSTKIGGHSAFSGFMRDYGMIFVLLLLGVMFSALTIADQHPVDARAGERVADEIVERYGPSAGVVIVTLNTKEHLAFADAVERRLTASGAAVLARVHGEPPDARRAIAQVLKDGKGIDAVAANNVTAGWTIYDSIPEVGRDKLVVPASYTWPNFLKLDNLVSVANQTAVYAIVAIGMTLVIITAGIDLSVGSMLALTAVASALVVQSLGGVDAGVGGALAGIAAGVAVGAIAGAFNGAMVTAFRIPAFIVTLAMMSMASGLAYRLSGAQSISDLPEPFFWLGVQRTLGLPHLVWLMIALYVIAHIVMTRMTFGRYVYAIGGNEEAARLSGVPVKRILLVVYTLCGALAGLGGVATASRFQAGDPKYGVTFELDVITAVVVGGTSLMGGSGKIFGTLIGAFIIAVIKNGMNLMGVESNNQKIVIGAVLLAAVLIDTFKRRRMG